MARSTKKNPLVTNSSPEDVVVPGASTESERAEAAHQPKTPSQAARQSSHEESGTDLDRRLEELVARETALQYKAEALEARAKELGAREEALKTAEVEKKQVLLRIPRTLWTSLSRWAEQDLRSINGQIEYLLTKAVREHEKK